MNICARRISAPYLHETVSCLKKDSRRPVQAEGPSNDEKSPETVSQASKSSDILGLAA